MSLIIGTKIVSDSIGFHVDFANRKCFSPNILNYSHWTVSSGGVAADATRYGVTLYSDNSGTVGESVRVRSVDPFGYTNSVVWRAQNTDSAPGNSDGGWDTGNFAIDNSKLYRFSVWTKRNTMTSGGLNLESGSFYLGHYSRDSTLSLTFSITKSNGFPFNNPYFHVTPNPNPSDITSIQAPLLGGLDVWTLVVGHVWPVGTGTGFNLPGTDINGLLSNANHPDSGVWIRKVVDSASELNYWKGDGNAIDSLNGANGIIATPQPSGPTWSVSSMTYLSGKEESAFSFSGSNFVVLPNNTLNYTGDFSAGLWFYAPSGMTDSNLISCFDNTGDFTSYNGWTIKVDTNDMTISFDINIRIGMPGNTSLQYFRIVLKTPPGVFSYNTWTHVLATRKGGARSRIYVGGTLRASDTNIYGPSYTSSNAAYIGADYYGWRPNSETGPFFKAAPAGMKIDEVRTFSAELSSVQAAALTSVKEGKIGNPRPSATGYGDCVWYPSAVFANHRAYLFYAADLTSVQSFIYPRVDIVDGLEPSIQELLAGSEPVRDLSPKMNVLYPMSTTNFDTNGRGLVFGTNESTVLRGTMSATFSAQTVSVWFNPEVTINSASSGQTLLQFGATSSSFYFMIGLGSWTGAAVDEVVSIESNYPVVTTGLTAFTSNTYNFQAGVWNNITISWDRTKYLMYINGTAVATVVGTGGYGGRNANLPTDVNFVSIGARSFVESGIFIPYGAFFRGKIGSVVVYERSLEAFEILSNYNVTKQKYGLI
jgi:hypothetical protein